MMENIILSWSAAYITAAIVTALIFSHGSVKSLTVLFFIGLAWWVVWGLVWIGSENES